MRAQGLSIAAMAAAMLCGAPVRAQTTWTLAPGRTSVEVSLNSFFLPVTRGAFRAVRGKVAVDFARPARSAIDIVADVRSLELSNPSFRPFVMGDAVFAAARFPTIAFAATSLTPLDATRASVTGNLTLRGVTRPVTLDLTVEPRPGKPREFAALTMAGRINRLDFGITAGYPLVTSEVAFALASRP